MSKTDTVKYRNDTGGTMFIPIIARNSPLPGAVESWVTVDDGKTFSVDCELGEPINPSLRVASKATRYGISLASTPKPPKPSGRRSRGIK